MHSVYVDVVISTAVEMVLCILLPLPHFSLIQVIRYNRLLGVIHQTLQDLLKALKGLVVMSQALETMANSLYNNAVPELWAAKVNSIDERAIAWSAVPCMVYEYMTSCLMRS